MKLRRQELGFSQARAARAADVGKRTLQRVEAGALPSADTIWRLERGFGLAPGSLVPGWEVAASLHLGSVGARIRERRRACGHTLTAVGAWIGMSAASLSRFERGVPRLAEAWDEVVDRRLSAILGFNNAEHLEDWLSGRCKDPPTSFG